MSNETLLALKPDNTGSGRLTISKQAYTFGPRTDETCRESMTLLAPFSIGRLQAKTGTVVSERCRRRNTFSEKFSRSTLSLTTWHSVRTLKDWHVKRFASRAQSKSTKELSGILLKSISFSNRRHHPLPPGSLMAKIDVACPRCSDTHDVIRNGHSSAGTQLYRCKQSLKASQLGCRYDRAKPETHQTIIDMVWNGSGCPDTARALKISLNTVIAHLKTPPTPNSTSH